jgi:hypothetical protein
VTSIITPPFSISANPTFTFQESSLKKDISQAPHLITDNTGATRLL